MTGPAGSLEAAQAWLQGAIMAAERPGAQDVAERLAGSAAFPASAGLAIYRRAFIARIAAAMRAQFPALCHALGEPLFDDFAAEYVRLMPPVTYTLHDLGRRFPSFLADQRPDRDAPEEERETWIDFMLDLARFERRLFELFDAPGAEGTPPAGADVPGAALRLQPAIALGRHGFNVAEYYHAVRRGEPTPSPEPGRFFIALVRTDYTIRTIALREAEFAFLSGMREGGTVAAGLEFVAASLGMRLEDAAQSWQDARQTRARWAAWGFFVEAAQEGAQHLPRTAAA